MKSETRNQDSTQSFERVETHTISLIRGSGDEVLNAWNLDNSTLLAPSHPLHMSIVLRNSAEKVELRLCPFTLCVLHAGSVCDFKFLRCNELLVIGINPEWMNELESRCLDNAANRFRPIETLLHPDIPPLIHACHRHMSFPECPDEPYLAMLVELITARVFWHRRSEGLGARAATGLTNSMLHGVLTTIEDQLDRQVLVTALAHSVSMSSTRFSRAFKRTMGISPKRYILERRVLRVHDLLQESTLSLADLALEAGFSSQAHMTAVFSRYFGLTPGAYRKHVLRAADEEVISEQIVV